MKTFPRTLKFVILPALAISSILALRVFAADSPKKVYPPAKYVLDCNRGKVLKPGHEDVIHFKKVLDEHSAVYYCMTHKHKNGKETPLKKGQCPEMVSSASAETTDTKEFTLICAGAHVTQQAGFNSKVDLDAVAAEFQ
jgi:hypothetical protein